MTATSDFTGGEGDMNGSGRVDAVRRALVRLALRVGGSILLVVALGLWFAPGASWANEVILFKLILSVGCGMFGLGMLQSSMGPRDPMVEIDTNRAEIRVLGDARKSEIVRFSDLSHAELAGSSVSFWAKGGRLLAVANMNNRRALANVVGALKDAGKLA